MQLIRQVIAQGEGVVIGCSECGVVEHLQDNEVHRCGTSPTFAVTLDANELHEAQEAH